MEWVRTQDAVSLIILEYFEAWCGWGEVVWAQTLTVNPGLACVDAKVPEKRWRLSWLELDRRDKNGGEDKRNTFKVKRE